MPKRIAYYVTDHGFGHATRAVALIRTLSCDYEIVIRNSNSADLFKTCLPSCQFLTGKTDTGPILMEHSIDIDEVKTNKSFVDWIHCWDKIIENEINFLKKYNIDLVISDISGMPFLAAKKAEVRSIGISNFSWIDILSNFAYKDDYVINELERAYSEADLAIELFGTTGLLGFRRKISGGLLCRDLTDSRTSVRKMLGIRDDDIAVLITFGGSVKFDINLAKIPSHLKIITPMRLNYAGQAVCLPSYYYETQNIVGAMDIVISKSGYGIFSECVRNRIPLFIACKKNSIEDRKLRELLLQLDLGKECSLNSILNGNILMEIDDFINSSVRVSGTIEDGNSNCKGIIDTILQ